MNRASKLVYHLIQSLTSIFSDSDSDGDLFDEVATAPRRRKMPVTDITKADVHTQPHSPNKDSPDKDQMYILPEPRPSTQPSNYIDCTESNDDDDDDDDDDLSNPSSAGPPCTEVPCPPPASDTTPSKLAPPRWENFFRADPVLTDESELDNSQNSQTQTQSTDNTSHQSQSPELFHEDESSHMTSSQSTHISDEATETSNQIDTVLLQVDDSKAVTSDQETNRAFQDGTCKPSEMASDLIESSNVKAKTEDGTEQKSDSQVSSDFELPPTPGSKVPEPEELKELYRKLAAGQEVVKRKIF